MSHIRIGARLFALVLLFAAYAPIHLATKLFTGRSNWPRRFLSSATWTIGVRTRIVGKPIAAHTLLICNHTSWLDIPIVGGCTGCRFVSKDALGHGFLHWLADQNATVYVRRSHVKGAKDQATAIAKALEGDKPIALFPEGTTGPGTHLLPFRSTLLEAANYADKEVLIRPVAIDFGSAAEEIGWYQEPGKRNVLRILGRRGSLTVSLRLLDPLDRTGDRKQLTEQARKAISDALGFKLSGQSPIAGTE